MSDIPSTELTPANMPLLDAFRLLFPEFSKYSDTGVKSNLWAAGHMCSKAIFRDMWPYAVGLLAAHYIVSSGMTASDGSKVGTGDAVITSKSVGGVSVSYAAPSTAAAGSIDKAGALGTTTYGRRFLDLVSVYGAGCVQL